MTREVTDAERLANVERDLRDHASTLTAHNHAIDSLEKESVDRRVADAGEAERSKNLYGRLDRMDVSMEAIRKEVGEFKRAVTRPLWALAGIFGAGFAGILFKVIVSGTLAGFIK